MVSFFVTQTLCWCTKNFILWKSTIHHSIILPIDAEVAEKFLNGIYFVLTLLVKDTYIILCVDSDRKVFLLLLCHIIISTTTTKKSPSAFYKTSLIWVDMIAQLVFLIYHEVPKKQEDLNKWAVQEEVFIFIIYLEDFFLILYYQIILRAGWNKSEKHLPEWWLHL